MVHGSPHPVPDEAQPPAPDLLGDKEKGDGLPKANRGVRAPNNALFFLMEAIGGGGGVLGRQGVVGEARGGGASIHGIFHVHSACVCFGGKFVRYKTLLTHGACL